MNRKQLLIALISMIVMFTVNGSYANPITHYMYFTHYEATQFNELIYFDSQDTLYGPVRSNDFIAIRNSPQFHGQVYTSHELILVRGADPFFAHEPITGIAALEMLDNANSVRGRANPFVNTENGRWMIRIMLADGSAVINRYPMGGDPADMEHVTTVGPLVWHSIFVDGEVEVFGELAGNLTIGSAGDMWLIDNIVYPNADRRGIWEEGTDPGGFLGLVSERNIIIRNNWANGKRNMERGRDIIINASLIALDESFTFQHQNDDWEAYQGPTPDERGHIFLKGSIAQRRRGYLHRRNHEGTGYGLQLSYDARLAERSPPGFPDEGPQYIRGRHNSLRLEGRTYILSGVSTNRLIVDPGAELILSGRAPLTVNGAIDINGTVDNPVTIRNGQLNQHSIIRGTRGRNTDTILKNVTFGSNINVDFHNNSLMISNCNFENVVMLEGNIHIDSSTFNDEVTLTSYDEFAVIRNLFEGGVVIDGNVQNASFVNNTVVGALREGLLLRRFESLNISNNIIAFNRWGIVNRDRENPNLTYNDVYNNRRDDYAGCEAGEGSISADPLFVYFNGGDYNLRWNSPCVDAGDPDSPLDPDGSRADMGALAIDPELYVPRESPLPDEFSLSAFPNPFNDVVKINVNATSAGVANWRIIDINGREIKDGIVKLTVGLNEIPLTGTDFKTAGLYFVQLEFNKSIINIKLAYLN